MYKYYILIFFISLCSCAKINDRSKELKDVSIVSDADLMDVLFIDSLKGYIVGGLSFDQTIILETNDGGLNWREVSLPNSQHKIIYQIHQVGNNIMAVGLDGKMYVKYPHLAEWQIYQNLWWERMRDFLYFNSNEGLAIVGKNWNDGRIYTIDSVGNVLRRDSISVEFNDLLQTSDKSVLLAGYGVIMYSDDKGVNWKYTNAQGDHFVKMQHAGNTIKALGYQGTILESKDNGISWNKLRNGNITYARKYQFNDFYWYNEQRGVAVGNNGQIMWTTDGGKQWQHSQHDKKLNFYSIDAISSSKMIITGEKGAIYILDNNIFN